MARLIWIGPAPLRAGRFFVESMQIVEVTKTEQRHLSRHVRSRRLTDPGVLSRQVASGKLGRSRVRQLAALAGIDPTLGHEEIAVALVEYLTKAGEPTKKGVPGRSKNPRHVELLELEQAERDAQRAQADLDAAVDESPPASARDVRRALAWDMRQTGMTLNAIAQALEVSEPTVRKDLKDFEAALADEEE